MTGPTLCAIPTCRQRGRHLPGCGTCPVDCDCHNGPNYPCSVPGGCGSEGCGRAEDCTGCLPRLATEGIVCDADVDRAARLLAEIERLTGDARLVAAGQVRRGHGGAGGKPGSRPPLNVDAVDTLTETSNKLNRRCIRIAITRGLRFHVPCMTDCIKPTPSQAHCSVCHETFGSVSGFDRHRRGGQCLDPNTIPGIHRNTAGIWRFDGGHNRAAAHRGTPQTDERAELVPASTAEPLEAI